MQILSRVNLFSKIITVLFNLQSLRLLEAKFFPTEILYVILSSQHVQSVWHLI
jgi:hypothetical protein